MGGTLTGLQKEPTMNDNRRRQHDLFNMLVLPLVIISNVLFLWTGNYEMIQFITFMLYMGIDSIWVWLVPDSVASPSTILQHHLVVLLVWIVPHYQGNPTLIRYSSFGPLVEINTWCLISRRNVRDSVVLQFLFYASWIGLRIIFYPVILYDFSSLMVTSWLSPSQIDTSGAYFYVSGMLIWSTMVFLNVLNTKLSYDLFKKVFQVKKISSHSKDNKFL